MEMIVIEKTDYAKRVIRALQRCVSADPDREVLHNIHFEVGGEKNNDLTMVATDGKRMLIVNTGILGMCFHDINKTCDLRLVNEFKQFFVFVEETKYAHCTVAKYPDWRSAITQGPGLMCKVGSGDVQESCARFGKAGVIVRTSLLSGFAQERGEFYIRKDEPETHAAMIDIEDLGELWVMPVRNTHSLAEGGAE